MIRKEKRNLWKRLDGIAKYSIDETQISDEQLNAIPEEIQIRNSKKKYKGSILLLTGIFLVLLIIGIIDPDPFLDAYNRSPIWAILIFSIFPVGIAVNIFKYFDKRVKITINRRGILYNDILRRWDRLDGFFLKHNSRTNTHILKIKHKNGETTDINVTNLEGSPGQILMITKLMQVKGMKE